MKQTEIIQEKARIMALKIDKIIVDFKEENGDCDINISVGHAGYIGHTKISEQKTEVTIRLNH